MAYNQGVISFCRQLPTSTVCDGDVAESDSRLEGEGGYDGDMLIWDESGEGILGLP